MREKTRRTRRVRWLAALLGAFVLALSVMPVTAWAAGGAVYVSADGSDDTGVGTQNSPYATLAKAVGEAKDGDTVYVTADQEIGKIVWVVGKSITITGLPADGDDEIVLSRADGFVTSSDPSRKEYNPAMIEVSDGSLTLTNIVLDDQGRSAGIYRTQMSTDETGKTDVEHTENKVTTTVSLNNSDIVQDAIIAAYDGTGQIVLGEGAVLRNFGGMSAVRITGTGGSLTMKSGSSIIDNMKIERGRVSGDATAYSGLTGAAGAVWIQGASFTMEPGSSVSGLTSNRAVYVDGGTAVLNGSINNVSSDKQAWQGDAGGAVHARGGAQVTMGGTVSEIKSCGSAVFVTSSAFEMKSGAVIKDCGDKVAGFSALGGTDTSVTINGEITGIQNANALNINIAGWPESTPNVGPVECVIGPDGWIHDNNSANGAVYIQGVEATLDIYGRIVDNTSASDKAAGVWVSNNFGDKTVTMYEGAEISRNVGKTGAGVIVSRGTFQMEGGKIQGNIASVNNAGVFVRRGGTFIMDGESAIISGNQSSEGIGGIAVELGNYSDTAHNAIFSPRVELKRGTVTENTQYDIGITGTAPTDSDYYSHINRYVTLGDALTIGSNNVFMDLYDFSLVDPDCDVKFGNASTSAETAATGALTAQNLTAVVGSFWFQSGDAVEDFTLTAPQKTGADGSLIYDSNKPVYAAVVGVGEDGLAPSGAEVRLMPTTVNDDGTISLTVPSGSPNGYGVVLVQESPEQPANVVSVTPADMTVYMGGNGGYKAVVDENGKAVSSNNSLPEPLFRVELPDGVKAGDLTFSNVVNSWELKDVGGGLYTFVPKDPGQGAAVRVQYSDGATVVTSDKFVPTSEVYNELAISIYAGEHGSGTKATAGSTEYAIAQGVGRLTVRAVSETPVVNEVKSAAPSAEQLATSGAVAVAPAGTTYTLNDTDVELPAGAKPSLLFDKIIDDNTTDRTALLNARIAEVDGIADGFSSQVKYLDLVDANNGNAWIAASNGVDVYWAYPEGVTASDGVKVLHFEDLHRSGSASGFDPADIASATVSEVEGVQRVPGGIKFHVDKASFSPFALVWDYDNGGGNQGGGGGTSTKYYEITATAGEGGSISPSGTYSYAAGSDVTFTIKPDEGYTIGDVKVDGKSLRQLGSYTFEDLDDDHTISVTFMRGSDPLSPDETGVSDWLETDEHVAYLHGYGDGSFTFGPENPMTRAEVAQMFYNLLLDKGMGDRPVAFEDVPEGAYYEEAVITLASRGILNGTGPTTYEPDRPITRAEFVAIAMRFSNGEFEGENPYVDVPEDAWYRDYVVGATSFGWIYGYQDGSGRFGPDDTITRGQATMVTNRMLWRSCDTAWAMGHMDELRTFVDLPQGHYAFFDVVEATNAHDFERAGGTRFEDWTGLRE